MQKITLFSIFVLLIIGLGAATYKVFRGNLFKFSEVKVKPITSDISKLSMRQIDSLSAVNNLSFTYQNSVVR
jgi:hypothetical protein